MIPIRKGNGTGISKIPARTAELVIDSLQTKLLSIWYRAVHCKQRVPEQLKQFGKFEQSEEWHILSVRVVELGHEPTHENE